MKTKYTGKLYDESLRDVNFKTIKDDEILMQKVQEELRKNFDYSIFVSLHCDINITIALLFIGKSKFNKWRDKNETLFES